MAMGSVHNTSWGQYGKKLTRNLLLSRNIWDLFPSCFSLWEASKAQERRKGKPEKTAAQNSNHFFRLIPIPGALSSPLRFGSEGAFLLLFILFFGSSIHSQDHMNRKSVSVFLFFSVFWVGRQLGLGIEMGFDSFCVRFISWYRWNPFLFLIIL